MMLFRCAMVLASALWVCPAFALDDPIVHFPAKTGVIIRLSPPAEISAKAKGFLQNAAPQFAPISDQLAPGLGSLIGNPTLAGIDANRAWYVAVLPRQDQAPAVVLAVPASDVAALKKAVGEGYWFRQYEDWGIYSRTTDPFSDSEEPVASIKTEIAEPLTLRLAAGELGVYLNIPALREAYGPQIEQAKEQFLRAAEQGAGPQAGPAQASLESNRKMVEGLLKAIEQTSGFASSISIGESALEMNAIALVEPDTDAARFLAKQRPSNLTLLDRLPSGRLVYYALGGDFSDLISASVRMSMNLYPDAEDFKEKLAELKEIEFQEFAGLFELGDLQEGVYRGITLLKVDSPEKYRDWTRETAASMSHLELPGLQQDVTFKADAETIEGVSVDVMRIVMTPDLRSDPSGTTRKLLQTMFGTDGLSQRFAIVDGLFVQAIGEGTMQPAIESIRATTTDEETPSAKALASIRESLPKEANLLMTFDIPRMIAESLSLAVESGQLPLPIDPEAIDGLDLAPSYAGLTIVAAENELRIQAVMPAEQVRGLVSLVGVLQRAVPRRDGVN